MSTAELFLLAVGLSMDAFAVAVCKGLSVKRIKLINIVTVGLYFGIFQALMPSLGYLLGSQFADKLQQWDHWIAFILLAVIGARAIKESFEKDDCDCENECGPEPETTKNGKSKKSFNPFSPALMFPMAIATSIDALAAGLSFSFIEINIVYAVTFIGIVTFILSMIGVKCGAVFGIKFKSRAEFSGGLILILLGLKILIEGLMA
ncbi:MAG: manganese efflux pump [Clostridiales bacterium]|jgi:putative Mn2+ efflux pump MntP|nr:manganese efflux pump [Clostridiales bacterium]